MILPRELKSFACRYHRNGVGGEGFYLCRFKWRGTALQAVLFPGDENLTRDSGQCAIIDPTSINLRWRGDDFEPAIRSLIIAYGNKAFNAPQSEALTPLALARATSPRSRT